MSLPICLLEIIKVQQTVPEIIKRNVITMSQSTDQNMIGTDSFTEIRSQTNSLYYIINFALVDRGKIQAIENYMICR